MELRLASLVYTRLPLLFSVENDMLHARARWNSTAILSLGILLSILTAPPLQAQASSGEAMTFPRQILAWYLAGDAERVWAHAGPMMHEMAESPNGLRGAAAEFSTTIGSETGVLGEQLVDHPEGGGAQVYVRAARHSEVPEIFWVVIFFPADKKVQMIMPQPRQTIRTLFPQVKLP
jgi:hypothetical protein